MKTIKITLNETGSTACIVKTFSVYQNSYKEQELEVFVPKSFFIESNGNEFVTTIKMGAILYGESGKTVETKSYFMDKIGEDARFYIYKALLPKSFVLYKGVQDLVFNVVNIDTNENTVLSIVTTQKAPLEVVASAYIEDEEIEPTDAEILYGLVAEKQNKDTTGDEQEISITGITDSKEVVEAINKTGEKVLQNIEEIGANAEDISQNASKISDLEAVVGTGQEYIGTLRGSVLPSDIGLNDFVVSQKSRQAKGGDLVLFVLEIEGATDKTYRYNFNGTEWSGYEIPPVELAGNGSAGLVAGTYGVGSENTTIVDIIGGEIKNIYVKDGSGDYRNVREYLNTDKARIDNILSGASSVGKALRAVSDELGNNIVDTYLTINAGATKRYVRDYALPRTFNDKYFLSAEGYVLEMPEAVVPQFSVISDQIGETELFEVGLEVGAEYELSRKNSSSNSICILANSNLTARLRLSTFIDDTPLSVELSNAVEFKTGEMVRVEFGSDFTLLGDNVLNVIDGDKIKQVLEVVRETSAEVTFEVWSNETYPSIFGLNTQTQRIVVAQGELGEQEVIEAEGTVAENSVVFSLNNFDLNTNTEIFFDLKVATVEEIGEAVEVKFELDGETVRIATPYNFESGQATVGMLKQVFTAFGGGFQKWAFKGFIREVGSDLVCFANLDSLADFESKIDEIIEDFAGLEAEVAGKEDTFAKNTAFNKDFGTDLDDIQMDGVASVGASDNVARIDHIHPSDTTKANDSEVVKTVAQTLTDEEKTQARANIGAGASGFSGDYDDLSNKPIIRADLSVTVASGELLHQHSGASSGGLISGSLYKAKDGAWELVSVGKEYIDNALLLKANDNEVVKTSGNQTVGGQKTFSNNATFKGDLLVEGDITQSGASYETHAEQIYTTKDEMILRDGATAGLGSGEAGFTFKKAASDGITDIVMKVKNDGILRVGKVGGIQPLATREETPTDNGFARWNATAKRFEAVGLKQTTGQSTTDIMSQKAITDKLIIKDDQPYSQHSTGVGNGYRLVAKFDYSASPTGDTRKVFRFKVKQGHGNGSSYVFWGDYIVGLGTSNQITCSGLLSKSDGTFGKCGYRLDAVNHTIYFYIWTGQYSAYYTSDITSLTAGTTGIVTWYTEAGVTADTVAEGINSYYPIASGRLAIESQLSVSVWDGTYPAVGSTFASIGGTGTGTEADPYIVDTAQKLAWLSSNATQSSAYGKYYKQTKSIDLAGHEWVPINPSSTAASYEYCYDGGGYTIYNLEVIASYDYNGLFGYMAGGSYIKNLSIKSGSVSYSGEVSLEKRTGAFVGAISGDNYTREIAVNLHNLGVDILIQTVSENAYLYTGGIGGSFKQCTVTRCSSNSSITSISGSGSFAGGIGGLSGSVTTFSNCTSLVSIKTHIYAPPKGHAALIDNGGTVTDCIAEGTLTGTNKDYRGQKADKSDLDTKLDKTTSGSLRRVYGVDASNNQELTEVETTPTASSTKLVTSGGIKTALDDYSKTDASNLTTANEASWVAKLLTGATGYGDKIVAQSLTNNGYVKYQSGLTIIWGKQELTTGPNTARTYSFPLSFANNCLSMVATMSYSADIGSGYNNTINIRSFTKSNYVLSQNWGEASRSVYYIAIGY